MNFSPDSQTSDDKFLPNENTRSQSPWNALRNGYRKSAFLPYKPSVTVLTNLQRGNTEAHTPVIEAEELNFHQKAAQGDLSIKDIENEPDIDLVDEDGLTPLMWACAYGQYPIVDALLQLSAKVDLENPQGQTALLFAAYGGYHEIVRLLIANGADVNHRDESGNTALIYAATGNNPHTTNELLSRNADFSILNAFGESAYAVAVKKENYVGQVPKFGFKVKLNHEFPEKWCQKLYPRWNQLWDLIPLAIRYFIYSIYIWCHGRKPIMDYIHGLNGKQIYGVPIGGIGSGTIGRGFKGEFCRFQLRPGSYEYETIHGNHFIATVKNDKGQTLYQKVLSCAERPKHRLQSWQWDFKGENAEYLGLYPRSWTVFHIPEHSLKFTCRQVSPVIPHNYKDSCIPGAVFIWNVENESNETKIVSITFTFQNGIGEKGDASKGCWTQTFTEPCDGRKVIGALIHHKIDLMDYTLGIASRERSGVSVTCLKEWNPRGNGREIWEMMERGEFPPCDPGPSPTTRNGQQLGVAVCAQTTIPGNSSWDLEFSLVWDLPKIHFGLKQKQYWKYYTKYFGKENAAAKLSSYCFSNYQDWEREIDKWQEPVLNDPELPDWYKSALFNETYFVADGGTVWLEMEEEKKDNLLPDDPRRDYGHFAYLEGHEYRMYNTYDVHFYASFALSLLWPKLQSILQRDFCDTILKEDRTYQWQLFSGDIGFRKVKKSIPHDLGDPYEEPFLKINAYPIHDVSEWRDLDIKFVLQSYRDYSLTEDLSQLKYLWKNICLLMNRALRWDKDGDGLIENQGVPDQTYDTWTMIGPSSYCGSLWLAALECTCEMATILSDTRTLTLFGEILQKAKMAFQDKLWNGQFYNFDCSLDGNTRTIMSDQLCGLWYLKCSGLENKIFPQSNVISSLRTIYENNVLGFQNGEMGAVNGMLTDGQVDVCTLQSEEVWVGVVYALSSLMIHEGMIGEGFKTAQGIYETVYNKIGMGFETPEALYETKKYRAIGYMRPLSIWSIQLGWEMRKRKQKKGVQD